MAWRTYFSKLENTIIVVRGFVYSLSAVKWCLFNDCVVFVLYENVVCLYKNFFPDFSFFPLSYVIFSLLYL